jgi:hypothetical protein
MNRELYPFSLKSASISHEYGDIDHPPTKQLQGTAAGLLGELHPT